MSALGKGILRTQFTPDARLIAKNNDGGNGWIEGYLSVFGNIDQQNETVERGAFAKSIKSVVPAGKVKLMVKHFAHGGDVADCIGTVTQAREDDYGLWIHAELSSVKLAQETRQKILEKHVRGLSVGFYPQQWEHDEVDGVRIVRHTEAILAEGTVTVRPANELCGIESAKSLRLGIPASSQMKREVMRHRVEFEKLQLRLLEKNLL